MGNGTKPSSRDYEFSGQFGLLRDPEPRHCERSEAISSFRWLALRLLRFARNDDSLGLRRTSAIKEVKGIA